MKKQIYINEILKSFTPEPLGQYQPNFTQSIVGEMKFKFVQMKGHAFFHGEIKTK